MAVTVDNTKGAYTIPALSGSGYVPIGGGTMTGALTLPAGAVGAPALMFTGAGATTGIYSIGANNVSISVQGVLNSFFEPNAFYANGSAGIVLVNTSAPLYFGLDGGLRLQRDAAASLALRNGTNQQSFSVYNTESSSLTNYERLKLTGVAGTSVNITAESLGTGAANLDVVITPKGTGNVRFPSGTYDKPGIVFNAYPTTGFWLNSGGTSIYMTVAGSAALKVGALTVGFPAAGVMSWSSSGVAGQNTPDAGFSRNAAGVVEFNNGTAGTFRDVKLRNLLQTEYHEVTEMTAPSAPERHFVRIYAEDNGSGKTRLMALFATGAAQQLAIEP